MDKLYAYMKTKDSFDQLIDFLDKEATGRDLCHEFYVDSDRSKIAYNRMKENIEKEKGLLLVSSIHAIGATKEEMYRELLWYRDFGLEVIFVDYPSTHIFNDKKANALALSVLIDVFKSLLPNKTFELRDETRSVMGRKKIEYPENWVSLYDEWARGDITSKEFMERTKLKKGTLYHLINEYDEVLANNMPTFKRD